MPTVLAESPWHRRAFLALAALVAIAFWLSTQAYFVPVTRGGDRNGYLLGGKMLAEGHIRGIVPRDRYLYLGPHWVMVARNRFALKYPLGLPTLYQVVRWLTGVSNWVAAAHQVSPAAAALGVFGTFALIRPIAGSFLALIGMVLIATSPPVFFFANLPNSHAAAFCVAVWGIYALLRWRQTGNLWFAIAAGYVLGWNFQIRYTEGLLLLPLLLTIILARRPSRQWIPLPIAWLVPVLVLVFINLLVLHHATGYSLSNESTAFSISHLLHNAPVMITQLFSNALLWVLPLSILGFAALFARDWKLATILTSWALPPILAYSAYYWIPTDEPGLSYVRFTLTVLPAFVLVAMWLISQSGKYAPFLATALTVAVAVPNLKNATARAAQLQWENLDSLLISQAVQSHIPPNSIIFAQQQIIPMLQVQRDDRFYLWNLFTPDYVQGLASANLNRPDVLQPQRAKMLFDLLGNKTDEQLIAQQNQLIRQSQAQGQGVYLVLPRNACHEFLLRSHLPSHVIAFWKVDARWCAQIPGMPSSFMQIVAIDPPPS